MKLLVIILSCHANRHKRDAIRDTWLKRLPGEHFFYTGIGDTALEPDVLQFPFEDTHGATCRTHAAFKYALEHHAFDWLFRVDDDTFVVPERIPSLFWEPTAEMIGGDVMAKWNWGTGGAGLLFSRRIVEIMVAKGVPDNCSDGDDGWACWRAREAGAKYYWTPRLRHQPDIRPEPRNDMVTGHYVTSIEMRVYDAKFSGRHSTTAT